MSEKKKENEVTIKEQIKKFLIKSMYGYQTVLILGAGRKLGILDYLHEKGKSSTREEKISTITFTPEEITENLKLSPNYLDSWLHMALECGIFELDDSCERCLKSAPHVYDLLIDRDHMFYLGDIIACFYIETLHQDVFLENFKTGNIENILDYPAEDYKDGQTMSARWGVIIERLFSKHMKDFKKRLQNQGFFLEVGCGYGLNLEAWATKYKRARIVGIDIDPSGIADAKKLIQKKHWEDRVELIETSVSDYAKANKKKFDIIMLNHVLHEMDPDENYRKQVIEDIYTMLKDDGLFIVGESMIPDLFTPRKEFQLFEIMHKLLEVGIGSRFYDENGFKALIDSTSFKNAELIKEKAEYFWAITK